MAVRRTLAAALAAVAACGPAPDPGETPPGSATTTSAPPRRASTTTRRITAAASAWRATSTSRRAPGARAQALASAGERVVAAGEDGVLRVWDAARGAHVFESARGRVLASLAVAPGGRLVATGGGDGVVRVYDLVALASVAALSWHRTAVLACAWAGATLATADADASGRVALWDVADLLDAARREAPAPRPVSRRAS